MHPALGEKWSAISTLQVVIDILYEVRRSAGDPTGFIVDHSGSIPRNATPFKTSGRGTISPEDSGNNVSAMNSDRMSEDTCEESIANSVDTLQWHDNRFAIEEQKMSPPVDIGMACLHTGACHMNECG